jgi:16S rRNA (cytidine1402-2'-O)-methyltransferase
MKRTSKTPAPGDSKALGARPQSASGADLEAGLYVTATPIGNARDITLRALSVLTECDLIAAEDTRVTAKLLAIHGIAKPLTAYNDHNGERERPKLLAKIAGGARVALVSDAGTPLVSDPGYKLVREAIAAGLKVEALPGASSVLCALALAGLPSNRFLFAGFLPPKSGERRSAIETVKNIDATLIFFESAQRLDESLADIVAILGPRPAAIAREMTKLHEDVRRGDLASLAAQHERNTAAKGEVTLVIGPPLEQVADFAALDAALKQALEFMPVRAAVDLIAGFVEMPRRQVYDRALRIKGE